MDSPEHATALGFIPGLPGQPVTRAEEPTRAAWPGHSVIVAAVPPLEDLVRRRTRAYDAAYLSTDPTFAHAHVTLLGPFVDAAGLTDSVVSTVGQVLRRHAPFTACFAEVARFPDGMIHLLPDDDEPFRRLTADLADAFPDHAPYGGRYPDPRPHVTLDRGGARHGRRHGSGLGRRPRPRMRRRSHCAAVVVRAARVPHAGDLGAALSPASVRLVQADGHGGQPLAGVPAELQPRPGLLVHELIETDGAPVHRDAEPPEVAGAGPPAEHHRVVGEHDANGAAARGTPERPNRYPALDQLVQAGVEERFGAVGVLGPDPFERFVQRAVLGFHGLGGRPRRPQRVIGGPRRAAVVLRTVGWWRLGCATAPPDRRRDGDDQREQHPPPVHPSSVRHGADIGSVVS